MEKAAVPKSNGSEPGGSSRGGRPSDDRGAGGGIHRASREYAALVRVSGAGFFVVGFLARVPLGLTPLAVLTMIAVITGSYTVAGLIVGAMAVGKLVGSPIIGRLVDQHGERIVVGAASILGAVAFVVMVLVAPADSAAPWLTLCSLVAGFAAPPIGALSRSRWIAFDGRNPNRINVTTALSYESTADQISFVIGPAVVGLLALTGDPTISVIVVAATTAVFGIWFGLLPFGASGATARRRAVRSGVSMGLAVLIAGLFLVGVLFAGVQVGITAFAEDVHTNAGLLYAFLGAGAALGGLLNAALPERLAERWRAIWSAVGMVAMTIPLLLIGGVAGMAVALFLLGLVIGPYLTSQYAIGERVAAGRVAQTMALLVSSSIVGNAFGSALAGPVVDAAGRSGAFVVAIGAAVLAVLLALVAVRPLARLEPRISAGLQSDRSST
jgi:MFS family permease